MRQAIAGRDFDPRGLPRPHSLLRSAPAATAAYSNRGVVRWVQAHKQPLSAPPQLGRQPLLLVYAAATF